MRDLVKAEILWTRKCPVRCSYCAMPNDMERAPVERMIDGARQLRKLGCRFFVIYGASPLCDFEGLPEFVRASEGMGIATTVIVDGVEPSSLQRLEQLYDAGLRSVTASWDAPERSADHFDRRTRAKSQKGLELMRAFGAKHPDLRDREMVATLTRRNMRAVLDVVEEFSAEELWLSWDVIHPDRAQPGTKCRGEAEGYRFLAGDEPMIAEFYAAMAEKRRSGLLIHHSELYLQWLAEHPEVLISLTWKCHRELGFPAWVAVDADGTVMPCDDFCSDRSLKVWDITQERFSAWTELYSHEIEDTCPGCAWSYWDTLKIRSRGGVQYDVYLHSARPPAKS